MARPQERLALLAADHLYELAQEPEDILGKAAEIEGHPDNVAAALYGGFVVCANRDGAVTATRLDPPQGVEAVVVVAAALALSRARRRLTWTWRTPGAR